MPRPPTLALLAASLLACWAPELAPDPAAPGAPPPSGPPPAAPSAAPAPLPAPPFTARTIAAPLTLVGPGGAPLATLTAPDQRVDVLQVLPERVRVRCSGCPGAAAGVEGWLQRGAIAAEPAGAPATGG